MSGVAILAPGGSLVSIPNEKICSSMIFFVDFPDGELPIEVGFPKNTVFCMEQTTTINTLIGAHYAGNHFAMMHSRTWLRYWKRNNAKRYLLMMLIERLGAYWVRLIPSLTWESDVKVPEVFWDDFRMLGKLKKLPLWKFQTDLASDYLGGYSPDFLFLGAKARKVTKLAFASDKGWPGYFLLLLKSAGYDLSKVGFLSLPKEEVGLAKLGEVVESIKPKAIIALGLEPLKLQRRWNRRFEANVPHPEAWRSHWRHSRDALFVKKLKVFRKEFST